MEKSILTTIATINATFLSIIFASLSVYFFYAYPKISEYKEQLSDLRLNVSQIMDIPYYRKGGTDYPVSSENSCFLR
jgi:hypothetical protein